MGPPPRALEGRLAAQPVIPSRDQLRRMAEARIMEIKTALEGHDDQRRAALRSLLRGRFFKVGPDPEKLFRVTGELQLGPIQPPTRQAAAEWGVGRVAGGRFGCTEQRRKTLLRTSCWPLDRVRGIA